MIRLLVHFFRRIRKSHGTQLFRLGILTLAILAFSSSGFMYFEINDRPNLTWGDSVWWAVVTMTTVGYGDLFPQTIGGRYLIGFPTMLFGISILGYLLSVVASYLIEARAKELKGMGESLMKDHILVVHYPGFNRTRSVIQELRNDPKTKTTPIVLVDDQLQELPNALAQMKVRFIRGNPSKAETLDRAGFRQATHAIVLARDPSDSTSDHHALAVVLTLEKLHAEIISTAECVDPEHIELFERAGCDNVVCLAQMSTNMIVQEALDPGVQGVIREITSNIYGQQLYVVPIKRLPSWRWSAVTEHFMSQPTMPVGIQRGAMVLLNPAPDAEVQTDDRLVCIGPERPEALEIG
ncbi:MAG: potassium channel family protein [Bradymonadia bacterium]